MSLWFPLTTPTQVTATRLSSFLVLLVIVIVVATVVVAPVVDGFVASIVVVVAVVSVVVVVIVFLVGLGVFPCRFLFQLQFDNGVLFRYYSFDFDVLDLRCLLITCSVSVVVANGDFVVGRGLVNGDIDGVTARPHGGSCSISRRHDGRWHVKTERSLGFNAVLVNRSLQDRLMN